MRMVEGVRYAWLQAAHLQLQKKGAIQICGIEKFIVILHKFSGDGGSSPP